MSKKSLPWLRLYTEFSTDYKVQMLPESMQRRLIMLFCFQREGVLNSMTDDEISYRLGISKKQWKTTRQKFFESGFINDEDKIKNGDDFLMNFSLRQKDSDNSAERTRTWRLKKVCDDIVTSQTCHMKQSRDVLDIDTDKDTEEDKKKEKRKKKILSGKPDLFLPPEACEIFEFWKATMKTENSKIDGKRKRAILEALKIGYSAQDICNAISGCAKDHFHMGGNDRNQKYNDISLICRDAEHIDKFIGIFNKAEVLDNDFDSF